MNGSTNNPWRWRQLDAIGASVCLLLTVIMYVSGIEPLLARHAAAQTARGQLQHRRSKLLRLSASLRKLQKEHAAVQEQLTASPLRLQAASLLNVRLDQVTQLAAECGLKVGQIHPQAILSGSRYRVVPIQLAGEGSYPTCVLFLKRLRAESPDTGVVHIDLRNSADNAKAARFLFSLEWYAAPAAGEAPMGGNSPAATPPPTRGAGPR